MALCDTEVNSGKDAKTFENARSWLTRLSPQIKADIRRSQNGIMERCDIKVPFNWTPKIEVQCNLDAFSGAGKWKDVLQLLKMQNKKMERLARALSVIQQGMLRNNPGFVKDSVNEATEVLSGILNTHKSLLESGMEF